MKPILHSYGKWMRYFTSLFNILSFCTPPSMTVYILVQLSSSNHEPVVWGLLIPLLCIIWLLAPVAILLGGNFYTEILSDQDGLHIKFLWKQIVIPWGEIIEQKPMFRSRWVRKFWVIKTRSLTPFHRLYGLLYAFSLAPSIVYSDQISNYAELNRRIRANLRKEHEKV